MKKLRREERVAKVQSLFEGDAISIKHFVSLVVERKLTFLLVMAICVFLAMVGSLTSPVLYTSKSTLLPENSKGSSQISGIAGLLGGSKSKNGQGITPMNYADIVSSEPFLIELIEGFGEEKELVTYYLEFNPNNLFQKTIRFLKGFPSSVTTLFKSKNLAHFDLNSVEVNFLNNDSTSNAIILPRAYQNAITRLKSDITITYDGIYVIISTRMNNSETAAALNAYVARKLVDYVQNYNTDKERMNVSYLDERTEGAKRSYLQAQNDLARFLDNNRSITSASVRSREEFLRSEFEIAMSMYKNLVIQLEQARFELEKNTPLFTEISPTIVPSSKSSPNHEKTFLISLFSGIILGVIAVFFSIIYDYFQYDEY